MGSKAKTNGVSLSEDDWIFVDKRAAELKLEPRKARSLYFQLMVDLDRRMRFTKHGHRGDGQWHLYEERQEPYGVGTPETTLPAEKAVREELERRSQSIQIEVKSQSAPPIVPHK